MDMTLAGFFYLLVAVSFGPYPGPPTSRPASAIPQAPQGFGWKHIDPINANFLMPRDWYFTERTTTHGRVFLFRKDEPDKPFMTGLTINVTREVTRISHIKPSQYAVQFMEKYTKGLNVTSKPQSSTQSKFKLLVFEVIKKIPETKTELDFRVRVVVIANDQTDTMYTILFGAPEKEWKEAWKIGNVILGMYTLDDHI